MSASRVGLAVAAVGVLCLGAAPARANHGRGNDDVKCKAYDIPVLGKRYHVFGQLCAAKDDLKDGAAMQVLVHGATYDHRYWDFGEVGGVDYSYARVLAAAGVPTLAIDYLGTGRSSQPPSGELTFDLNVEAIHDVVTRLRAGKIGNARPDEVVLVGNSMGSLFIIQEAARYGDADGLILTGMPHHLSAAAQEAIGSAFYPAASDPALGSLGLDPGYLTTRPGTRDVIFFNPADSDPRVRRLDEARKGVVAASYFGALHIFVDDTTLAIDVPVLTVIGSTDILCDTTHACAPSATLLANEIPFFDPAVSLSACSVPDNGHSVNLHERGHERLADVAIAWQKGQRLPRSCAVRP